MPKGYPKNGINKGWIKKGQRLSPATELKKGVVPLTCFKKGHTPWSKDKKFPYQPRPKMLGHIPWNKDTKGVMKAWNKNIPQTEETKKKLREAHLKRKELLGYVNTPEAIQKRLETIKQKGGLFTPEQLERSRIRFSGSNNPNWKDGITPLVNIIRTCPRYIKWRTDIFFRDKHTCQECGQVGGKLCADHIEPFSYIFHKNKIKSLEEALNCAEFWDLDNGQTLCLECHKKTDTYLSGAIKNYGLAIYR